MLRRATLAASLVGSCTLSLPANTVIDRLVRAELALNSVPSLALAIVERGEIGPVRAYGIQSVESGQPLTVNTPVGLASLSKDLAALAILRLEQGGRVERGAAAAEILPRSYWLDHHGPRCCPLAQLTQKITDRLAQQTKRQD